MESPRTPDALIDNSPVYGMTSNRLRMLVDQAWPEPSVCDAESQKSEKKAKRRIKKDVDEIVRDNLLTIFKLVCKELMDSSLVHGRLLDDEFVPLQQFFTVLEHILLFSLRTRKFGRISIPGGSKDPYSLIENLQKLIPDSSDIFNTIKGSAHIKTQVGRTRAFIRLAMMQKKLYEYLKALSDCKELLSEYYEPGAILLDEENSLILIGLLVGLNCIDCHVSIRDDRMLDDFQSIIDYSLYLSEASLPGPDIDASPDTDSGVSNDLSTAIDQVKYLEEHNSHLTSNNQELKAKLASLQERLAALEKVNYAHERSLKDVRSENEVFRSEANRLASDLDSRLQMSRVDAESERDAYVETREGLETLYSEADRRLKEETKLRHEAEREVQLQIAMRTETEMAVRLLERDVHEKQDLMMALRNQLDDVKGYNIEAHSKLQLTEAKLKEKSSELSKCEQCVQALRRENEKLNGRLKEAGSKLADSERAQSELGDRLAEEVSRRSELETDLKIEKEWRSAVQDNLTQSEEKINRLQTELNDLKSVKQDLEALSQKHKELQGQYKEQETALTDMAAQLGSSKMKHEDLREVQQAYKDAHWADDEKATNCKLCENLFNVARRKHHCRHCGHIFCNECSDQKMLLPSSAKPVRVCDSCNIVLLNRSTKT